MTAHGGPETRGHKLVERLGMVHDHAHILYPAGGKWKFCERCGMSEGMIERMNASCAPTPTEGEVETGRDSLHATRWSWLAVEMAEQATNHDNDDYRRLAMYVIKCMADTEAHIPAPTVAGDATRIVDVGKLVGDKDPILSYIDSRAGDAETEALLYKILPCRERESDHQCRECCLSWETYDQIATRLRSTPEAEESE